LTTCPDVSSPKEPDYKDAVFASLNDGKIEFDNAAFKKLTYGSIHTIEKCRECYAKWNCGSGCPSSRRVYNSEIFDAICDYYRKMLCFSLMDELADKYQKSTGKDMYKEIGSKL
jgi:radical SAM protein with 4Fe4S-binding SPASM domain